VSGGLLTSTFGIRSTQRRVAGGEVVFLQATGLADAVDVGALLADDAAPEPPYWMHLWPGAKVLADLVAASAEMGPATRVLELGSGLGLPALVAALRGAKVCATDWKREPLTILGRSAALNGRRVSRVQMDWADPALRGGFDLCLGADVAYDAGSEDGLARALSGLVRPHGRVWLADSVNTHRRTLPARLLDHGLATRVDEIRAEEEGRPVWVRVIRAERTGAAS
jgi:predicted nicotinamide N-methyase